MYEKDDFSKQKQHKIPLTVLKHIYKLYCLYTSVALIMKQKQISYNLSVGYIHLL